MRLLENKIIRFILQLFSILLILISNSYTHSTISIYNRFPIITIILFAVLLWSILSNYKNKIYFEIFSYFLLFGLLFYRLIFEMEGFVTFNRHLFNRFDYFRFGLACILLVLLVYYYINKLILNKS